MILVISQEIFHPGFNSLLINNTVHVFKKYEWEKLSLIKKIKKASNYKILHYYWARASISELIVLRLLRHKIILHFIGSDVLIVLQSKSKQIKMKLFSWLGIKIVAVHSDLKRELESVGIKSNIIEFVNRRIINSPDTFPKEFLILAYIPEGEEEFYNLNLVFKAAIKFKKINFYVFPNSKEFNLPNLFSIPLIPHDKIPEIMSKYRLFLRLPRHDGLPNTLVEALMAGIYAAWTFDHPHVYKVETEEDLFGVIREVKKIKHSNIAGKKYVLEHYNIEKLSNQYKQIWKQ